MVGWCRRTQRVASLRGVSSRRGGHTIGYWKCRCSTYDENGVAASRRAWTSGWAEPSAVSADGTARPSRCTWGTGCRRAPWEARAIMGDAPPPARRSGMEDGVAMTKKGGGCPRASCGGRRCCSSGAGAGSVLAASASAGACRRRACAVEGRSWRKGRARCCAALVGRCGFCDAGASSLAVAVAVNSGEGARGGARGAVQRACS